MKNQFFKVSIAPSISYHLFIKEVTHEINFFKNNPRLKVWEESPKKKRLKWINWSTTKELSLLKQWCGKNQEILLPLLHNFLSWYFCSSKCFLKTFKRRVASSMAVGRVGANSRTSDDLYFVFGMAPRESRFYFFLEALSFEANCPNFSHEAALYCLTRKYWWLVTYRCKIDMREKRLLLVNQKYRRNKC